MHKNLDLVSNPEIKWTKSRSRLEARDWRKQNLDLVSKVKLGISSMSDPDSHKEGPGISNDNIDGDWCYLSNVEVVALT